CARAASGHAAAPPSSVMNAALHSITSSAATSNLSGMLRPSALTLLRLITRSNLVERCTPNEAATRLLCRLDRRLKYARQRQAEEWLHRRQLPWRTYVRRAVAPPSQDDCRSGTARVHPRRRAPPPFPPPRRSP